MTRLSVIIPTFNRAAFLAPCVASVRANVDAEIIIVDDGLTDDTEDRVRELDGVIFIRQSNAGPATARNTGAARSSGEYLAFLDCDDTWRPGVAPNLIATLDHHPEIDVVYADAMIGNPTDGFTQSLHALVGIGMGGIVDRAEFFRRMIQRNQVFLGATIVRRTAFDTIGGFDPQLFGGEDYEFVLRLAQRGPFGFIEEPLANYLKHPGSISSDTDRMDREFATAIGKIIEKCPDLSPEESELVRRRHRWLMYNLGYNSYSRGEFPQARQRFRSLFREYGPDAVSVALWATCQLPAGFVRRARRIKHTLLGARR